MLSELHVNLLHINGIWFRGIPPFDTNKCNGKLNASVFDFNFAVISIQFILPTRIEFDFRIILISFLEIAVAVAFLLFTVLSMFYVQIASEDDY